MNHLISKDAFEVWHDDPKVVAAILPLYMDGLYLSRYSDNKETPALSDYFETPEEAVRQSVSYTHLGSPTKVKAIQNIVFQAKESKTISGSDRDVEELIVELLANHTIG